ncbi:iron-containing alcohol dehydrogenase [Saccharopolyspora spinosa]|uniref:Alcohol dehydrogenase class IV n=1 Tax=Saccharopolyspora spinosa TaxID=60894 RepID=A0A2N3Y065_SACSN|nr:iron-containing alcohol dehydrogenase [Saccharopolyspora spinosa]PKW16308.1 alcohol dehydrogenase class IV [Saccharopolyspora spinosa]
MIIDFSIPTRVVFGRGRLAELGRETRALGASALLVCGRNAMRSNGILAAALSVLGQAGVRAEVFDQVSPDPRSVEVDAAVRMAVQSSCDVIVGLGGGSALDAAKATAIGMRHGESGPLVGRTLPATEDAVPVVAVPTTAGSGAEVTKGAIITDTERGLKSGIRGEDLFPRVAVVDPDLLRSVPGGLAAETGFDALAHAVEGYVARRANRLTRLFALEALDILGGCLTRVVAGETGAELHERMALAALLGGLNVATASTCLPHRMQQSMGSVPAVAISHGRGLATIYPTWLAHAYSHATAEFDTIGRLLGDDDVHTAVSRLLSELGLPRRLSEGGFGPQHIDRLLAGVTGNVDNDPVPGINGELIRELYERAL